MRLCRLLSRTSPGDKNVREGERVVQASLCIPISFCWDGRGLHWHVRHFLIALSNRSRISEAFWRAALLAAHDRSSSFPG